MVDFNPSLNLARKGRFHTDEYLKLIGVPEIRPATSPFDPGYDAVTLSGHLEQSHHLMSILKVSILQSDVVNIDVISHLFGSRPAHSTRGFQDCSSEHS